MGARAFLWVSKESVAVPEPELTPSDCVKVSDIPGSHEDHGDLAGMGHWIYKNELVTQVARGGNEDDFPRPV